MITSPCSLLLLSCEPSFKSSIYISWKYPRITVLAAAPFLVHSSLLLTVDGDAILDIYKTVKYTRLPSDPETFLLVNLVLDPDVPLSHGTQNLLETNGATRGTIQVIAHFPG